MRDDKTAAETRGLDRKAIAARKAAREATAPGWPEAESRMPETARRRMEEYLLQSEERLRIQYRYIPVPTLTWRRKGDDFIVADYNIAMEELTDGMIGEHLGARASVVFKKRPDILADFRKCYTEKRVVRRETPYRLFTNRKRKHIAFTYAYVPPDLVLVHLDDITPRKEAEEALLQSRRELRRLSARLLAAAEQERKRMARDLHDSIGQHLSAIKFNAESILGLLSEGREEQATQSIRAGIPVIRQTIEEVRRIIMDLRPTILDDLGIIATISWFCREFQQIYGHIQVERKIALAEEDVPAELKIVIYRLLQEGLNNVAKHSGARLVRISLGKDRQAIRLAIADDGRGFDPAARPGRNVRTGGIGLVGMRERTEFSGGRLRIVSAPGRGTRIAAAWPLTPASTPTPTPTPPSPGAGTPTPTPPSPGAGAGPRVQRRG